MKVMPKPTFLRNDCFYAIERDSDVRIEAFRQIVKIEVNGEEHEMSLTGFAQMLKTAVMKDKKRVHGYAERKP